LKKWLKLNKKCVTWGKGVDSVDNSYLQITDNADIRIKTMCLLCTILHSPGIDKL